MSVYFNSTNYINLGQPASLSIHPKSNYSITAWVYVQTSASAVITAKAYASTASYQIGVNAGKFYTYKGGAWATGTVDLSNKWHFISSVTFFTVGAWYSSGQVDVGITDSVGPTAVGASVDTTSDTLIGAQRHYTNSDYTAGFTGYISDLRFYNRVLTLKELASMYHSRGRDRTCYGLIGRYFLLENSPGVTLTGAGVIKDESINKSNGTPNNNPTQSNRQKIWQ